MLDVGAALLQAASRAPRAEALVDGDRRWTYAALLADALRLAGGLRALGLAPGERIVSLYQNTSEAALLHWAAQLSGIAIVPLNWRATAAELDYCAEDAGARAVFFQDVSAEAVAGSTVAQGLLRIGVGPEFQELRSSAALPAAAHGDPEAW